MKCIRILHKDSQGKPLQNINVERAKISANLFCTKTVEYFIHFVLCGLYLEVVRRLQLITM